MKQLPEGLKTVSAVIMALAADQVERQDQDIMMSCVELNNLLVRLKIRKGSYDVPNLSSFLSHRRERTINVKSLIVAVDEFSRNQYLQSFGTVKKQKQPKVQHFNL